MFYLTPATWEATFRFFTHTMGVAFGIIRTMRIYGNMPERALFHVALVIMRTYLAGPTIILLFSVKVRFFNSDAF